MGANESYTRKSYAYNDVSQVLSSSVNKVKRALGADTTQSVLSQDVATLEFVNVYDSLGWRSSQTNYTVGSANSVAYYSYRGDGQLITQLLYKITDGAQKKSQASFFGESGMFDGAGNQVLSRYAVYNSDGVNISYTGTYSKTFVMAGGGYKEGVVTAASSLPGTPGSTSFGYDRNGAIETVAFGNNLRFFALNRDGQITTRSEPNNTVQNYFYYDGKALANVGTASAAEISDTVIPISAEYPAHTASSYLVSQGDTFESIAQAVWGDSGMWYLIADANALDSSKALLPGSSVRIPNVVGSTHNNATTFKPYNVDDIIGDNTPSPVPPPPPKPKKKKSSGLASIVMVVVAVVATVLTAGAAAPAAAAVASSTAIGSIAATGAAVLTGSAALTGAAAWMGLGAAVLGGVVGSAASQLVGKAMGVVDSFSWKQVAVGGLTTGITAGFGTLAEGGVLRSWGRTAAEAMKTGGAYGSGYAALGVFNYANSQVASRVVGLDNAFNWRNVAASAAGATIAGYFGGGDSRLINSTIRGEVSAFSSALIKDKWLGGEAVDYAQVAADAFGNTLADYTLRNMSPPQIRATMTALDPRAPLVAEVNSNSYLGQQSTDSYARLVVADENANKSISSFTSAEKKEGNPL